MQRQMVKKARDVAEKERREGKNEGGKSSQMPFEGELGEFFIDAGHTPHVAKMEDVKKVLVTLAEGHC
jgi:hypothetical protein